MIKRTTWANCHFYQNLSFKMTKSGVLLLKWKIFYKKWQLFFLSFFVWIFSYNYSSMDKVDWGICFPTSLVSPWCCRRTTMSDIRYKAPYRRVQWMISSFSRTVQPLQVNIHQEYGRMTQSISCIQALLPKQIHGFIYFCIWSANEFLVWRMCVKNVVTSCRRSEEQ